MARRAPKGPDFSGVTSRRQAEALVKKGELEWLFLLPAAFGGDEDDPRNSVPVPVGLAEVKAGIDRNVIGPQVQAGQLTRYQAVPEYAGESFVPIAIRIEASEPGSFSSTIAIWGAALGRS